MADPAGEADSGALRLDFDRRVMLRFDGRWRCRRRRSPWSLTSLREKLIKIGAKVVSHGRYVTFQMAEVAVPRQMFARNPLADRPAAGAAGTGMTGRSGQIRQTTTAEVCLHEGKSTSSGPPRRATRTIGCERGWLRPNFIAVRLDETEDRAQQPRNPGNVG